MRVKKKNPEWFPSENKDLKVGEIVEITDPKSLIINGDVVAVNKQGAEISAYELYGIIVQDERREFEEWMKMKQQKSLNEDLKKESEELKEEVKTVVEEKTDGESKTATEADLRNLTWNELTAKFRETFPGEFKPGLKREEIIKRFLSK